MNRCNFRSNEPRGNANPNARVNELKARYGVGYNYRFLELDNLQREFYFEMVRREKEQIKKKGKGAKDE